jgi:P4 family phage/plasmid primase-like protien
LKTIAWYARKDSPNEYAQWHTQICKPFFDKAISRSHYDVAHALFQVYWLDYVCISAEKKRWLYYNKHRWISDEKGTSLIKKMSEDFISKIEQLRIDIDHQAHEAQTKESKAILEKKMEDITDLISKLKNGPFKKNILNEAMNFFFDPEFTQYQDTNPNLIGIYNGVVETCPKYAIIRDGKPEDYLTKFTMTKYEKGMGWEFQSVKDCMKWMKQVFVDEEILNYFLKLCSACLYGKNIEKLFWIMVGEGNNSKSKIKILFQTTFGPYCVDLPTTVLTMKRSSSNSPTPELAQLKGARAAFLQEPENDDEIKVGKLKEFTGGDSFFARLLNENGGKIDPTFKLFLMCNRIPCIPNSDKAGYNRLLIIPFLSTWVTDPPESEEEQYRQRKFKIDYRFDDKIKKMGSAFLWILIQFYEKYIIEGLEQPELIKECKNKFCRENDPYQQFIDEKIELVLNPDTKLPDERYSLSYNDVKKEFMYSYKEDNPGVTLPKSAMIKQEFQMSNRLGKLSSKGWVGLRFKGPIYTDNLKG